MDSGAGWLSQDAAANLVRINTGWLLLGPPSTPLVLAPGLSGCCALPLLVRSAGEPGAGVMSVKLLLRAVPATSIQRHLSAMARPTPITVKRCTGSITVDFAEGCTCKHAAAFVLRCFDAVSVCAGMRTAMARESRGPA